MSLLTLHIQSNDYSVPPFAVIRGACYVSLSTRGLGLRCLVWPSSANENVYRLPVTRTQMRCHIRYKGVVYGSACRIIRAGTYVHCLHRAPYPTTLIHLRLFVAEILLADHRLTMKKCPQSTTPPAKGTGVFPVATRFSYPIGLSLGLPKIITQL